MTDNVVKFDDATMQRESLRRALRDCGLPSREQLERRMTGTVQHDLLFPALKDLLPCPNPNCRGLPMVVTKAGDVVCNACGAVDQMREVREV